MFLHGSFVARRPAHRICIITGSVSPRTAMMEPPSSKEAPKANIILWLRQDLRLHDNPALFEAAKAATSKRGAVTLVYIDSPAEEGEPAGTNARFWRPGAAARLWTQYALESLDRSLQAKYGPGAGIVYLRGPYLEALRKAAKATGSRGVYLSRRYDPGFKEADEATIRALLSEGYDVRTFNALLLREPWEVKIDMSTYKGHFGTLMPFVHACSKLTRLPAPLPVPEILPVASAHPREACGGMRLEDLGLYSPPRRSDGTDVDWAGPIRKAWGSMDEQSALDSLRAFISTQMSGYEDNRGFADGRGTSKLSPFLHFGQLSPRLMLHELDKAKCRDVSKTFHRRLIWRDLAYWQMHHWPELATSAIRPQYQSLPWGGTKAQVEAWRRGRTGFPLIDAGMRELWATGWMQQNVRMAAACFLTEYLGASWVLGEAWFHDTLVDADSPINGMMWQNAGGVGMDPWNFTVLPTSAVSDPDGSYIRRWVPELAGLPTKYLRAPWTAPPDALRAAGVELGATYPHRIFTEDPGAKRDQRAQEIRGHRFAFPEVIDKDGYDTVICPPGSTVAHDGKRMRVFTKHENRTPDGAGKAPRGVSKARAAPAPPSAPPTNALTAAMARATAALNAQGSAAQESSIEQLQMSDRTAATINREAVGAGPDSRGARGSGAAKTNAAAPAAKGAKAKGKPPKVAGPSAKSGRAGNGKGKVIGGSIASSGGKRRQPVPGEDNDSDLQDVLASRKGQRTLLDYVRSGRVDDTLDLDIS